MRIRVSHEIIHRFVPPARTVNQILRLRPLSFEDLRRKVMEVAAKGVKLQRFKGLGEMNADQLRETTMDPASRTLERVQIDDAAMAEKIFTDLMGDKVEPRRAFIEDNARLSTTISEQYLFT